jgi:omega-6 fatty acid desaturase (delta-12 desaturase)
MRNTQSSAAAVRPCQSRRQEEQPGEALLEERYPDAHVAPASHTLMRSLSPYRKPNSVRSIIELVITAVPFVVLWIVMWAALHAGYWIGLALAVPAAGFLVRLFMIQHDCGHGSFFRHRLANDWIGRVIGVLTLTPYDFWRRAHALHHASSGNLERRGIGDIDTLTVSEFQALAPWRRFLYRLYRNPVVMFGVGPAYLFILRHRLPMGLLRGGLEPWISAMATNAAIAIVVSAVIWDGRRGRTHARATADHASRCLDRRLAILCPTPVRGYLVGARRRLDFPRGGTARQLAL